MKPSDVQRDAVARAAGLVGLFCSPEEFGHMRGVAPHEVPEPDRTLLDHESHMTVAMERFHGGQVRLRVVASRGVGVGDRPPEAWYAREILLETEGGKIVQYGIVRLDLMSLEAETVREILEERRPLGRILIEAGVLRDVRHVSLLEVTPGPHLSGLLWPAGRAPGGGPLHGRVADIQLNGRPAVQLLEVAVPG
ncbi:MAG: hypothetical protein ACKOWG_14305 [Planctomycetia bacterium]